LEAEEKWIERWIVSKKLLKDNPVGYYKRALKRRQSQVKWLKKKIKELEAQPNGS